MLIKAPKLHIVGSAESPEALNPETLNRGVNLRRALVSKSGGPRRQVQRAECGLAHVHLGQKP